VTASSVGVTGCLLLGIFGKKRINSESKQGPFNCNNATVGTWYATKSLTVGPDATGRPHSLVGASTSAHVVDPNATVPDGYDAVYSGGSPVGLIINADGTFSIPDFEDTGYWISLGKSVALTVTVSTISDVGCIDLGTVKKHGINSLSKQGPFNCNNSAVASWYETRGLT